MMKTVKYVLALCATMALMTATLWAQADKPATTTPAASKTPAATAAKAPAVTGTITAVDATAKTLKVKDAAGKESTFTLGAKCTIKTMKSGVATDATLADLKKDMAVRVTGTEASAKSVTAAATAAELKSAKKTGAKTAATAN